MRTWGSFMQGSIAPPLTGTVTQTRLDPAVRAFLDWLARQGGSDESELSVEDARAFLANLQSRQSGKLPVDREDRTILVGPRGNIAIRIVRPRGACSPAGPSPRPVPTTPRSSSPPWPVC